MIILVNRFLLRKNILGITLWPFVILKYNELRKDKVLLNHEGIHLRQQLELLVVLFFVWYTLEFIIRLSVYKNRSLAYRNISLEREAYKNEKDRQYLDRRSFWRFLKYI